MLDLIMMETDCATMIRNGIVLDWSEWDGIGQTGLLTANGRSVFVFFWELAMVLRFVFSAVFDVV